VPSTGPTGAELAFVGIAPGFQETFTGEPFTGPSGRLLDEILKRYNIAREEVFLTNVVWCHPDRNVDPPKEAIEACRPRLTEEIQNSKTIVALGGIASKAILGTNEGILKTRVGPPKHSERFPNAKVIPTVHPAAALRSSDYFPFIVTDLAKIRQGPKVWTEPTYNVPENDQEAIQWIEKLTDYEPLSIDIEVAVEKDIAYERPEKYQILCVGIGYSSQEAVVFPGAILEDEAVKQAFANLLGSTKLIAQNGKFDIPALRAQFGPCKLWFDTMLSHYALDERGGIHGLKAMAREYLEAPNYSLEIKQYTGRGHDFGSIPSDILYKYNAYDCVITYALYELFAPRLVDEGLLTLHDFFLPAPNSDMAEHQHRRRVAH